MIDFRDAHVAPGNMGIQGHAFSAESLDQRSHRGFAAKVDRGAGPVKYDQIKVTLQTHYIDVPGFKRLATTSSPRAKPVDAPAPLVTIARRTAASGASMNAALSGADA
jgi:hypothetical protein